MSTFIGTAPTPEHAEEREQMERRFVRLATKAGVGRDFAAFRQEVLCRYLKGERRHDELEAWAEDVFALREDEAQARAGAAQ